MNETQIKIALISKLEKAKGSCQTAFIQELFVDNFSRRADLVVANGKLAAFEIKSEKDSLDRLSGQLDVYCRFFELTTVVCAEKHLSGVERLVTENVGIWKVSAAGKISVVRKPILIDQIAKDGWLSFLPVDELRAFLRSKLISATGCRDQLIARAEAVSLKEIRACVLDYLKNRGVRINEKEKKREQRRSLIPSCINSNEDRVKLFLSQVGVPCGAIPRQINHSKSISSS